MEKVEFYAQKFKSKAGENICCHSSTPPFFKGGGVKILAGDQKGVLGQGFLRRGYKTE